MMQDENSENEFIPENKTVGGLLVSQRWLRSKTKMLVKILLLILFVMFLEQLSGKISSEASDFLVLLWLIDLVLLTFSSFFHLVLVFILYWLIDHYLSKTMIPLILRWILSTVILVFAYVSLITLMIAIVRFEYFQLDAWWALFRVHLIMNYRDILVVFKQSPFSGNILGTILMSGWNWWPHLTLLVPAVDHLFKWIKSKKQNYLEIISIEQDEIELYQQQRNQKYIFTHGSEKPLFSLHRSFLKILMLLGYLMVYLGMIFFVLLLMMLYSLLISDPVTPTIPEVALAMFLWIIFVCLGYLILKHTKRKLDTHYMISSYKIQWRINISLAVFIGSVVTIGYMSLPSITSFEAFLLVSLLLAAILASINSIRLRRKWKQALNQAHTEFEQAKNSVSLSQDIR
jgi:hypothetical protein